VTNIETGITATPSGTQTTAYKLLAQFSRVDTVGTNADSVTLPKITPHQPGDANPGQVGMIMFIANTSGATLQVYGATPDTINNIATGTGLALTTTQKAICVAESYNQTTGVGTWTAFVTA
jgi:hypothetical protein